MYYFAINHQHGRISLLFSVNNRHNMTMRASSTRTVNIGFNYNDSDDFVTFDTVTAW